MEHQDDEIVLAELLSSYQEDDHMTFRHQILEMMFFHHYVSRRLI
jgi:hypothetical protein